MRRELIEPPTQDRITQVIRSALTRPMSGPWPRSPPRLERAECTGRIGAQAADDKDLVKEPTR